MFSHLGDPFSVCREFPACPEAPAGAHHRFHHSRAGGVHSGGSVLGVPGWFTLGGAPEKSRAALERYLEEVVGG